MLPELAKTDDLEKKWPKEKLLLALGFSARVRHVFHNAVLFRKVDKVSLKDLMEEVVSNDKDPRPGYVISRLLGYKNMGKKSFWAVIDQLNKIDLGEKCNTYWNSKYEKLMSAYRVKGSDPANWSIPTSEKGKGYVIQSSKKDLTPPDSYKGGLK